ncbi:hypothetical protein RW1_011_02080 [Rhodococcus wratislaviensis NBRC 100605]|uniref:Transposase n=1 Tax=Rhodococcus wratislaviensis NBRC 100605 TaxID=1219028 RepID=X0PNG1_RHOWR|nr:hypothetical protein RW1_011_02080 [Rhodococcus wratislaviensis NBRC 100605]
MPTGPDPGRRPGIGHRRGRVDRSRSTLGGAAIAAEHPEGLLSDYRGFTYDDRHGINLARLLAEGMLHRLIRLAATVPPVACARLSPDPPMWCGSGDGFGCGH